MFDVGLSTGGKQINKELFASCRKSGIKNVEIRATYEQYCSMDYTWLKNTANTYGVNLWSYHLPFKPYDKLDISSSDKAMRKTGVEENGELIKRAADIGINKYITHSGSLVNRESKKAIDEKIKCACESYSSLAEIASQCGGTLVLENLTPISVGKDIAEMDTLLSADKRLKLCFDTNHLLGDCQAEFIRHFADRLITLHISDCDFENERHWLPGEGKINWKEVYKALCEVNYKGPWLYEVLFKSEPTLIRTRDLNCDDFVRNANELFADKEFTRIP